MVNSKVAELFCQGGKLGRIESGKKLSKDLKGWHVDKGNTKMVVERDTHEHKSTEFCEFF